MVEVLKRNQGEEFKRGLVVAREYFFANKKIDVADIELSGRYPERGKAVNMESTMVVSVLSGRGAIVVDDIEYQLEPGNKVLIPAGEEYYWQGELAMLVSSTPAWSPEQHQNTEE